MEGLLVWEESVSADETRPPTERETFLVRFIYDMELTSGADDRVLAIPARRAWDDYQRNGLYFCRAERPFRPSAYLAFYRENEIEEAVPRITGSVERGQLTPEDVEEASYRGDLDETQKEERSDAVRRLTADGSERYGSEEKVLFLGGTRGSPGPVIRL